MNLFLSKNEAIDLTGYQRPSCQIRWLQENGLKHVVAADGHPRIYRSQFVTPEKTVRIEPDFTALIEVS